LLGGVALTWALAIEHAPKSAPKTATKAAGNVIRCIKIALGR
jgi:hypothetical protein